MEGRLFVVVGIVVALLQVGTDCALAQEPGSTVVVDSRLQDLTYTFDETGAEMPYALFVPSHYDASREWPLIVGLHGLGRPYDWVMSYEGYVDIVAPQSSWTVV